VPRKVRWGVLGAASIAVRRVIPAMQNSDWSEIAAIASRARSKAEDTARMFGIPKAYGSYEELLSDPEIEAVYNPLPNNLHVPWTNRAAQAGKHVLCEKPLSMNAAEARSLVEARDRAGVKIGEAFMVRTHPRWIRTRDLVRSGRIGELRLVSGLFSCFNRDPKNVRNITESGGGALLDLGCYFVTLSRFLFEQEPARVMSSLERDPEMGTDRLTSAIMEFPAGQCVFTCSTQLAYHQRMFLLGTKGRIEIERPINPPTGEPCRIVIDDDPGDPTGASITSEIIPECDQFTIQGDLFSRAIREGGEVPVPLEDAICNMAAIDAIFRSAESSEWEEP
jgi:predicted dehydrogenase